MVEVEPVAEVMLSTDTKTLETLKRKRLTVVTQRERLDKRRKGMIFQNKKIEKKNGKRINGRFRFFVCHNS